MQSVKFERPPLIEVVFGVNIEITDFSLVHFGLYWETIKERFPMPVETFGELTLTEDDSYTPSFPTAWFLSSEENKLIRLTEDYFSYHCRCINEEYKHFDKLFQEFLNEWYNLESWWSNVSERNIKIKNYSLQYINLIDRESDWKGFEDNQKIFKFDRPIKTSLGLPKAYLSETKFELADNLGTLIVSIEQKKLENLEGGMEKVIVFTLSVISSQVKDSFSEDWFCSAHNSIIQAFLDLTTEEAQEKWGRIYE